MRLVLGSAERAMASARAPGHPSIALVVALLPALVVALALLWTGAFDARTQWTLTRSSSWCPGWCWRSALRERVVRPLQTLSNMLAAIREQDYLAARRGAPAPTTPSAWRCSNSTR